MKHILFFDIDGTLFNSEKKIPAETIRAIKKAKENGHEVAIATGRPPFMIRSVLEELEIDTYVCYNGQYVVYKGQPVYTNHIPKEQLVDLVQYSTQKDHPLVYLDDKRMVTSTEGHPHIVESFLSLYYPLPEESKNYYLENLLYQVLVFMDEIEEKEYVQAFPELQFVRWHPYSCDILPKDGSKARGIEELLKSTQFSLADAIAFGDGLNDVEMLSAVGTGVAMGNGHPKAKECATFVTDHVDHNGLANAMKKLQLI